MKVIKQPAAITTEETCKNCGVVLELNPLDYYKEETHKYVDPLKNCWRTIIRKWYICPYCHEHEFNAKIIINGKESES